MIQAEIQLHSLLMMSNNTRIETELETIRFSSSSFIDIMINGIIRKPFPSTLYHLLNFLLSCYCTTLDHESAEHMAQSLRRGRGGVRNTFKTSIILS